MSEKQPKWCHLVISNPRESLVTKPNLRALAEITWEHFLHDDRFDLAYSATILALEEGGIAESWKQKQKWYFCCLGKWKGAIAVRLIGVLVEKEIRSGRIGEFRMGTQRLKMLNIKGEGD